MNGHAGTVPYVRGLQRDRTDGNNLHGPVDGAGFVLRGGDRGHDNRRDMGLCHRFRHEVHLSGSRDRAHLHIRHGLPGLPERGDFSHVQYPGVSKSIQFFFRFDDKKGIIEMDYDRL